MNAIEKGNPNGTARDQNSHSAATPRITLTEDEFLERELHAAVAGMRAELKDMKTSLGQAANVRLWTRHYPWASMGVAATAGFAAAILIGRSRDRHRSAQSDGSHATREEASALPPPKVSVLAGLPGAVLPSLFKLAKAIVQALIITQLKSSLFTTENRESPDDKEPP